jgi:hypothetical protein
MGNRTGLWIKIRFSPTIFPKAEKKQPKRSERPTFKQFSASFITLESFREGSNKICPKSKIEASPCRHRLKPLANTSKCVENALKRHTEPVFNGFSVLAVEFIRRRGRLSITELFS